MDGLKLLTDPSTGPKRFKHVGQLNMQMRNFQKDLLTPLPGQSTLTFESNIDPEDQKTILFLIDTYGDLDDHENKLLVAISSSKGNIRHILCVENNSIILKEGELPDEILSETNEFIFYLRYFDKPKDPNDLHGRIEDGDGTLESSVERGLFLACSDDGRDLILKRSTEDDETTIFSMASVLTSDKEVFKSYEKGMPYHIQDSHGYFLVAHPEESVARLELDGDTKGEQATFFMNIYKELAANDGVPVIFSCKVDNKNYLLSVESNSVVIKESELPEEIPTETSGFIFYIKEFSNGHSTFRFESSLKFEPPQQQRCCLAWNKDDPVKKLILKPFNEGGINESINFFIEEKV